jgi:hypothetical protein
MNKIKIILFYFLFFSSNILFSTFDPVEILKFTKININKLFLESYFNENGDYEYAQLVAFTCPLWIHNYNPKSFTHRFMLVYDIVQLIDWTNKNTKEAAIKKLNLNENFLSKSLVWMMENTPSHNGLESIVNSAENLAYKVEHFGEKFSVNEIFMATIYRTLLIRNLSLKDPKKNISNKMLAKLSFQNPTTATAITALIQKINSNKIIFLFKKTS